MPPTVWMMRENLPKTLFPFREEGGYIVNDLLLNNLKVTAIMLAE